MSLYYFFIKTKKQLLLVLVLCAQMWWSEIGQVWWWFLLIAQEINHGNIYFCSIFECFDAKREKHGGIEWPYLEHFLPSALTTRYCHQFIICPVRLYVQKRWQAQTGGQWIVNDKETLVWTEGRGFSSAVMLCSSEGVSHFLMSRQAYFIKIMV